MEEQCTCVIIYNVVHMNILRYFSLVPRLSLRMNGSDGKQGRTWEQGYECFYGDQIQISGKGGSKIL